VLPLSDPKRLLGLSFVLAVAVIWVGASFVVQGIQEQGAHPAVLTFVANSLFAVYVPIYYLNLRWRQRRQQAAAAAAHAQERTALVPAQIPRSEEGDTVPSPLTFESGQNGEAASLAAPPMPLRQLFRAALVVSACACAQCGPCTTAKARP
jgi:solute carrier family 35 protein F5